MHPEIHLPFNLSLPTYGLFMMVGFLSGVWLCMRRAMKVKADPDFVLDLSFWALVFGVIGARVFYVVHYWSSEFRDAANPWLSAINITRGGLEFLGGVLGATVPIAIILFYKRASFRLYADIIAPSVMWGAAFGRIGCFFNGCCFGGPCLAPQQPSGTIQAAVPWAVEFPFGSPGQVRQWQNRQVTVPAELIFTNRDVLAPVVTQASALNMPVEQRLRTERRLQTAEQALQEAKDRGADKETLAALEQEREAARKAHEKFSLDKQLFTIRNAQQLPSREHPGHPTSASELEDIARATTSLPIHPAQLYSAISAALIFAVMSAVFRVRKRHGLVFGLMLVMYPVTRVLEELIRADNPLDTAGLTISQFLSICIFAAGIVYLAVLYKKFPLRAPNLKAWVPPKPAE